MPLPSPSFESGEEIIWFPSIVTFCTYVLKNADQHLSDEYILLVGIIKATLGKELGTKPDLLQHIFT